MGGVKSKGVSVASDSLEGGEHNTHFKSCISRYKMVEVVISHQKIKHTYILFQDLRYLIDVAQKIPRLKPVKHRAPFRWHKYILLLFEQVVTNVKFNFSLVSLQTHKLLRTQLLTPQELPADLRPAVATILTCFGFTTFGNCWGHCCLR